MYYNARKIVQYRFVLYRKKNTIAVDDSFLLLGDYVSAKEGHQTRPQIQKGSLYLILIKHDYMAPIIQCKLSYASVHCVNVRIGYADQRAYRSSNKGLLVHPCRQHSRFYRRTPNDR